MRSKMKNGKKYVHSQSPGWITMVNSFISFIKKDSNQLKKDDAKKLMDVAGKRLGLYDFGDQRFLNGYLQFMQSLENEGRFTPVGRFIIRRTILNYLTNRLLVQQTLKSNPQIKNISISRPIFIAGLSRTGTTLLHNLLSIAPGVRAPRTWEILQPAPSCKNKSKEAKKRIRKTRRLLKILQHLSPCFKVIHPINETAFEECYNLINHTFTSPALAIHYGLEEYHNWLKKINPEHERWVYSEYAAQLKILQSIQPEKRWILKSAIHLYFLDSLLKEFPDATIIQTHREPEQTIPSICSLISCFRNVTGMNSSPETLGLSCLRFVKETLDRGNLARKNNPQVQFIDIQYNDLVAKPIEQIHRIHEHCNLPWDRHHEERLYRWFQKDPFVKRKKHQYSLYQFGLDKGRVLSSLSLESDNIQ